MEAPSEIQYQKLLHGYENENGSDPGLRSVWTQLFVGDIDKHLDTAIRETAGKWVVEETDVYNPFSGIINNASEANHSRYKKHLQFKENVIDIICQYSL